MVAMESMDVVTRNPRRASTVLRASDDSNVVPSAKVEGEPKRLAFSPPARRVRAHSDPLTDISFQKARSVPTFIKKSSSKESLASLIRVEDSKSSLASIRKSESNMEVVSDTSSEGDDCFPDLNADIENRFSKALTTHPTWGRQITAPGRLQIADWTLHGEMKVIYESRGSLTNSTVHAAVATSSKDEVNDTSEVQSVAVKTVSLNGHSSDLDMMHREISILKDLGSDHPHVLPLLASEMLDEHLVVLTRLAPDGDLARVAPQGSCLEEQEARRLSSQLLSALSFLEDRRIVHGDLKPPNVLLTGVEGAFLAQLTDFGLASRVPETESFIQLENVQGSYGFIPAEVKSLKQLSFAADMFALGVILFRLLSSYDPFYPASAVEDDLIFDPHCWGPISEPCQALVRRLLSKNPTERGSARETLQCHEWLTSDEVFCQTPRTPLAPKTLEGVSFHNLEDSARHWNRLLPCG